MPQLTIDAEVLLIEPHPDQATRNPGCWAVQFRVSHAGETRTFWRWHSVRKLNANGAWIDPDCESPSADEILKAFWDDTFNDLYGFNFRDGLFNNLHENSQMSKKTTKSTKTTKPAAKKAAARAKIEQRLVTLSGLRPKKASSTPTLPAARPSKTGAKKKLKPKKVIAESRGATLSAPRSKPAHKPASKPSPSTIVPSQDNASAPYYPDHAPKGEERDFAPMVGYFDKATSVQDLRERMLFRRALGDHPEDVLVAGERKARAMGWSIDAIEVEQPEESADEPEELASAADEPQRSDATSSAGEPEELTTSADESAQPMEAVSEQPEVSAIESSEVSAVESVQSTASAAALDQQEAQTHENVLPVTAPEHTATPEEAVP